MRITQPRLYDGRPMENRLRTLTITEACKETGMSRPTMYRLLEEGAVAGNRIGKCWRVSAASLEAWVNQTHEKPKPVETRAFPEVEDRFA